MDWVGGLILLGIVATIAFLVFATMMARNDVQSHRNAWEEFKAVEQTCPKCGWQGYAGAMNMTGQPGSFFPAPITCYCPQCGYVLGEFVA